LSPEGVAGTGGRAMFYNIWAGHTFRPALGLAESLMVNGKVILAP